MSSPLGPGSLQGITVLEIGTSVAAPWGAQILGDLGANVIKIERKGTGDDSRSWAPPEWEGHSVTFLALNRNKKSLVLDYKSAAGAEVLATLIGSADVLIQNLRPGALARAGFSAERIRQLNPRLIYCELSGYGGAGPKAMDPAYDPLMQAYSGIVSMTGDEGSAPSRVPVSVLDMGTGMWTAIAVFDALRKRDATGKGAHLELSLLQTALSWLTPPLMSSIAGNPAPKRLGSGFPGVVPYGAFPTSDGYIFISVGNEPTWARFIEQINSVDLANRVGFATNADRVNNRAEVVAELGRRTSEFTTAELVKRLGSSEIPHAPVNSVGDMLQDEQVIALGQIQQAPEHEISDLKLVNLPMTSDGEYAHMRLAPPALGADTVPVLSELGLSHEEIDDLQKSGVVETTPRLTNPAPTPGGK